MASTRNSISAGVDSGSRNELWEQVDKTASQERVDFARVLVNTIGTGEFHTQNGALKPPLREALSEGTVYGAIERLHSHETLAVHGDSKFGRG